MFCPIRILLIDDDLTYRRILSEAATTIPEAELIATAPNTAIGLRKLAQLPVDLVLLDVHVGGMEALQQIHDAFPQADVVVVGSNSPDSVEAAMQTLHLGAIDFIAKPSCRPNEQIKQSITASLRRAVHLVQARRDRRHSGRTGKFSAMDHSAAEPFVLAPAKVTAKSRAPAPVLPCYYGMVVIGISTGGPKALLEMLPELPMNLGCPVLIVQHMPALFTTTFAAQLNRVTALPTREATDNEPLRENIILIAPGGRHMTVRYSPMAARGLSVQLHDQPPVQSCRPSVDVLFQSVATATAHPVLAVIMTGMGHDGAEGLAALKSKRCYTIAQNKETCVVYGMPRVAIERGLADEILPLEKIAPRIVELVRQPFQPHR